MPRKGTRLASGRDTPWDLSQWLELEIGEPEWNRAWEKLKELTGDSDFVALCPDSGECWQYMNTAPSRGEWVHCFRHRNHPVTQERWYVNVPADMDWVERRRPRKRKRIRLRR